MTYVESTVMFSPANISIRGKERFPDDTRLDPNDEVQMATVKGWYELEESMSAVWVKNESFPPVSNAVNEHSWFPV